MLLSKKFHGLLTFNYVHLFYLNFAKMKKKIDGVIVMLFLNEGQGHQKIPRPGTLSTNKHKIYGNAL